MILSPRLKKVADMVKYRTVADIGTDHGKIPVYLIKNKIADKVIASDINEGPVNSCKKNVKLHGVADFVTCRKGSGMTVLKENEADTVIIAGMGGELISNILNESKNLAESTKEFILQPMNGIDKLRRYLYENEFLITDEDLAREDRRIYTVIKARKGKMTLDDITDLVISPILEKKGGELFFEFIKKEKSKAEKIINGLTCGKEEDREKLEYMRKILKRTDKYEIK